MAIILFPVIHDVKWAPEYEKQGAGSFAKAMIKEVKNVKG
jgi:hypothetical protein